MKQRTVGVDIGATKTTVGVVEDSVVIKEAEFLTSALAPGEQILQELVDQIKSVAGDDFYGIGIGVPGLVDEEQGISYDLNNIPAWKEVHLKEYLESHFQKPVRVTNDANVFAVGEKIFGEGKNYSNLVGVTLGSGFGTGIIVNNKLYSGILSSAGELGSIPYLDGTVEDYCSAKFFAQKGKLTGSDYFLGAEAGDEEALAVWKEYGNHLGYALKIIMSVLSPEAIFLGGSISQAYPYFKNSLNETINSFPFRRVLDKVIIKSSTIKNIPVLGAAAIVLSEQENLQTELLQQKEQY